MNPSRLFILRPVATSLLMVAILLAGLVAYRLLPISALPEVDYPTIQVKTLYPGASPDVMTSAITAPLERQRFCAIIFFIPMGILWTQGIPVPQAMTGITTIGLP